MHRPVRVAETEQEATMTARVLRVIFDKLTSHNNRFHFAWSNHSLGPRHLADSVRQK